MHDLSFRTTLSSRPEARHRDSHAHAGQGKSVEIFRYYIRRSDGVEDI
jgi:hypothetical protein